MIYFFNIHNLRACYSYLPIFQNSPYTTDIYTLSLHDALPILMILKDAPGIEPLCIPDRLYTENGPIIRSEEHTSELQSRGHLVCRLLLEKKKYTELISKIFFLCVDVVDSKLERHNDAYYEWMC